MDEVEPDQIAEIAVAALRAAGHRVSPVIGFCRSSWATFNLMTPSGQAFRVQVEEQ